jgi:hypothetical protein
VIEGAALLARARVAIAASDAASAAERDLADAMACVDEAGANRYRPLIQLNGRGQVERARLARLRDDEPARELRGAYRLSAATRSARIESERGSRVS